MATQFDKTQDAGVTQQTQNTSQNVNSQNINTTEKKQTADASKITPSEMSTHLGPPTIEHDYPEDSKHRRHSVSHQEQHYMR
ncbi:hypothetical protein K4F52_008185 [Lecanicillium sp. MT-2017a]|nr:hypothetical protein K4F52_008185 [Lecanicillium sp. MT-2017a]